jgi:AcrR family transcriptional regulator
MEMKDEKMEDRRTRRTRRALTEALVKLAAHHPYESITIRDITEEADVGYATFFRHYDGKDALMLDVFQNIARDLEALAGEHGTDFFKQEGRLIFAHVRENTTLYRSLLDSLLFTRKLKRLFAEHIGRHARSHAPYPADPAISLEVAVNHMASSLVSLIEWWLGNGLQPPVEQMARIYDRLVIGATWQAMQGIDHLPRSGEAHGHTGRRNPLATPTPE